MQQGNLTRGIVIPSGGIVLLNHAWATIKVCGLETADTLLHSHGTPVLHMYLGGLVLAVGHANIAARTHVAGYPACTPVVYNAALSCMVQVLRDTLNCTLPIEIVYNGPAEMDAWAIQKFEVGLFIWLIWV